MAVLGLLTGVGTKSTGQIIIFRTADLVQFSNKSYAHEGVDFHLNCKYFVNTCELVQHYIPFILHHITCLAAQLALKDFFSLHLGFSPATRPDAETPFT